MKTWLKTLLALGLGVAGAALLRLTVFRPTPVPVTVHAVELGRVEDTVVNSRAGTIRSRRRAEMSPGIPGLVTTIAVQKGSRVRQGEVLLRLDDSEHRAQVELTRNASLIEAVAERVRVLLKQRHKGTEDFTITTQTGMLETLNRVISIISFAVAGIGGISLLVGSIGILTMMWISVNERTSEIGLIRAIGATPGQILLLFLSEAILLSTLGGLLGLATGIGVAQLLHYYVPALPVRTPLEYVLLALAVSFLVGLLSGLLPARRASRLNPVAALAAE